jgi:putative transposase
VRYAYFRTQARIHRISRLCAALAVSRSGYYAWRDRPVSARTTEDQPLLPVLRRLHAQAREGYGAIKLWRAVNQRGIRCGRHRVTRFRKLAGLEARRIRRFRVIVEHHQLPPPAPNLLQPRFVTTTLNRVWVGDVTAVPTRGGWLYVAVLLDLCSRRTIGRAMRAKPDQQLTLVTLGMTSSMSRKGNGYDNAVAESFFSTLKNELIHHQTSHTRDEASRDIFAFIEGFYNRQRVHHSLGYLSPLEFERRVSDS